MLKTEVFDMDKKKNPKRGFALRPSTRTTGLILDAVYQIKKAALSAAFFIEQRG